MVQIKEFRVVMPLSLEEYQIAQMHMVMKMQQQNTTGDEGVEILESKPFQDDEYGRGQYTFKVYHLQSKVPSWLTTFAPTDSLILEEQAWNAYPKCKTVLKCPYFAKFTLTVETIHVADNGHLSNVHNLNPEKLALRSVEYIDIATTTKDYWNYVIGGDDIDISKFQSHRTGRGPLLAGWQEISDPVMTAYKLVTVDAPYWGFGSRLEHVFIAIERALFQESHKHCFSWIDEWYGLTLEDIQQLEYKNDSGLKTAFTKNKSTPDVKEEILDESQYEEQEYPCKL
uniref:Phosphatidylinositol transfer protein N-terminal domain-containing protein n=1 Tax=Araucaria cunninghamii TaxID=56994 RepID=A0A0D6R8P8_ARACU